MMIKQILFTIIIYSKNLDFYSLRYLNTELLFLNQYKFINKINMKQLLLLGLLHDAITAVSPF